MGGLFSGVGLCVNCRRSLFRRTPRTSLLSVRRYSSETVTRHGRQFRMAVVGSGPAGFYTASRVMTRIQDAKVDMYEALPVPFGLVRFGVAPDHPEVKNCQDKFEEVASSPNFTFIGNVSVSNPSDHSGGVSIPLSTLLRHYDAILFAYGASKDKVLDIPGESSLKGIYSAREFVGWYNGLPEHANLNPDLTQGEEAVIIGQGNVALDVARMLLEKLDVLKRTDIADHALETLSKSRIRRVHIVGRRGPMQAAFTIKEIREMIHLFGVNFHPVDISLISDDLKAFPRATKRLMDLLLKKSVHLPDEYSKSWSLDFCLSPKSFEGDQSSRVVSTVFERTSLSAPFQLDAVTTGTGQTTKLPSSVVFRSIGYKAASLDGFAQIGVPFDSRRGIIHNDTMGRVQRETREPDGSMVLGGFPGLYCAGWVKRGPTGVIASTMIDSFDTADAIAEDWASGAPFLRQEDQNGSTGGWEAVRNEISQGQTVSWKQWQKIDHAERERGEARGKEREKFTSTAEMLAVAS